MADIDDRKAALITQLAGHRTHLSHSARGVEESLRVGRRIRSSFMQHRAVWLAGAVFAGLAVTRFRPRKSARSRRVAEKMQGARSAGFAWPAVKLIFDLARPTLISLLTARLADFAAGRTAPCRDERARQK